MRDIPLAIGLAAQGEFLSSRNKYFFLQKIAFFIVFLAKVFLVKDYTCLQGNTGEHFKCRPFQSSMRTQEPKRLRLT